MKREKVITTGPWPHKAFWNQQRLKRRLEYSFLIVKQLHFSLHHSTFKNRAKQVRFYLLFNFHLQFKNKRVGSLCVLFTTRQISKYILVTSNVNRLWSDSNPVILKHGLRTGYNTDQV